MILNLLNEDLKLNEEINIDRPDISTSILSIYEIEQQNDLNSFELEDNETTVAEKFGLTPQSWNANMLNGQWKAFIVTLAHTNTAVAAFLLSSAGTYDFAIHDKTLSLPISFEGIINGNIVNYNRFCHSYTLPLYTILDKYKDFTGYYPDDYIVTGQYIRNGKLYGIFREFFDTDNDGHILYPQEINLNQLNLTTLSSNSINYNLFAPDDHENVIYLNFFDNLTQVDENAINEESIPTGALHYCGDEGILPQVLSNNLSQELVDSFIFEDEERHEQRVAQMEQERREREERHHREKAQAFYNELQTIYDQISDPDYVYNEELNDKIENIIDCKEVQLEAIEIQYVNEIDGNFEDKLESLKSLQEEAQYKSNAKKIFDSFNEKIKQKLDNKDYEYSRSIDSVILQFENIYDNCSDREKEILDITYNFTQLLTEYKNKQEAIKNEYIQNRTKTIEDKGIIIYNNSLAFKIVGNEVHLVSANRSLDKTDKCEIPEKINDLPVTTIDKMAFINNRVYHSIYFPSTIKYIGESAFYNTNACFYFNSDMDFNKVRLGRNALNYSASNEYLNFNTLKDEEAKGHRNNIYRY